ncbi:TPA: exodeoxyribonuclease VII small subunit [Candidatus Saccharibacteria bacterium]|nr:exodeoxyribonuclease VII small subunit [Candidatus Saccharibacteria bacterium]HRK41372.1 exodeoxyribonuclease VII small subunit [Candidatus Saccharibacteria bacterium]
MSQKNLREKLDELQRIVADFDRDDLSIEQALEQFEKGSKLSEEIETQLGELKTKITVLKERFDKE